MHLGEKYTKNHKHPKTRRRLSARVEKREKSRIERRRARRDPEVEPGYGRYQGYSD